MKKKTAKRSRSELEKLTDDRYQNFAKEFVLSFDASDAYVKAGFEAKNKKSIAAAASRLLNHVKVKKYLEEERKRKQKKLAQKYNATEEAILKELCYCAFSNMGDYAEWDGYLVKLKKSEQLTRQQSAAIQQVSQTQNGFSFKLHDKKGSLELLARMQGFIRDKVDLTSDGKFISAVFVVPAFNGSITTPADVHGRKT